ncbi:LuxR C-terminal-related transcriptional regulator [Streptomyces sp. NPDC001046]|uniref:LuxR C-terminal-related transcriptional regulator n=1 Tax=Streptomyces sp. NPDC001046 TaxID=3364543 RepID=UPI00368C133E
MRADSPPAPHGPRCDEPPGPAGPRTASSDDGAVPAVEAALLLLKDGHLASWTEADPSVPGRPAPGGLDLWLRTGPHGPLTTWPPESGAEHDVVPGAGTGPEAGAGPEPGATACGTHPGRPRRHACPQKGRAVRLPRPYRRLVQCLAVLGEEVPLQWLGELVERVQEVAAIVEAGAEAGLVLWHPGEGRVSVPGPMRPLVIATMSASETCFAHRWAARHAQGAAALLHRAAAACGPDEDLARQLDAQARRLAANSRPRQAAELARRAADVSDGAGPAARRTADVAEFALRAHDLDQARRALARLEPDTAPARHRALAGRLAVLEGRFAQGAAHLGDACRDMRLAGQDTGLEAAAVWAVEAQWLTGTPAAELRERLARWAVPRSGDPYGDGARRRLDAILTAAAEGPAKALEVLTTQPASGRAAVTEAWLRLEAGDPEGCEAAVRAVLGPDHADRPGADGGDDARDAALVVRGHALWLRGAWGPAEASGRLALRSSSPLWRSRGQELLDLVAASRGSTATPPAADAGQPPAEPSVPGAVARLFHALVADEATGGTRAAALLATPGHRLGLDVLSGPLLPWRRAELARAAVTAGDKALAATLLAALRSDVSAPPWVRACALWVEARAAERTGSRDATARLYAQADETATAFERTAPWYYARYQADHAEFLAAAGSRRAAVDRYRAAWTVAVRLGAEPLRVRCATGLRALRMPGRAQPFALTARETEVARLVSSGLTNREAAARLFVTPASVGFHLGNIYGKLGVRSRYELRRWWAGQHEG